MLSQRKDKDANSKIADLYPIYSKQPATITGAVCKGLTVHDAEANVTSVHFLTYNIYIGQLGLRLFRNGSVAGNESMTVATSAWGRLNRFILMIRYAHYI